MNARLTIVASIFALCGCTTRILPPPEAPARELPSSELDAPDEGDGAMARVVITTDVPARVEMRHGGTYAARDGRVTLDQMLCIETPCTVTLPYGDHELHFRGVRDHGRSSTLFV